MISVFVEKCGEKFSGELVKSAKEEKAIAKIAARNAKTFIWQKSAFILLGIAPLSLEWLGDFAAQE